MKLHLVRLAMDRRALARTVRHGAWDEGYLLHAGLSAAFAASPEAKPEIPLDSFCLDDTFGRGSDEGTLFVLGYSRCHEGELRDALGPRGEELVLELATRSMPAFAAGTELRFRARVCPVTRTKRAGRAEPRRDGKGRARSREVDAWLAARFEEWTEQPPRFEEPFARSAWEWTDRERVYGEWLARELQAGGEREKDGPPAASLVDGSLHLESFRRARMHRRGGGRIERPDALLVGSLKVEDPGAFTALLARGLGRHRAFGFGMLRVGSAV